ncbi:YceD family protein [Peptoniphilus raoultii]|uniref:YceD family protein n=1 Tax=Peptoniphilus raoultii TaxID=1776387 RepID=UPI0008D8FDB4|nr:DUF177 domain-containing protein [Peptoniphilus raoultii]
MLLNIRDFLSSEDSSFDFQGSLYELKSPYEIEDLNLNFPINYKGKIINLTNGYELDLDIDYSFKCKCSRCLKDIKPRENTSLVAYNYKDKSFYDEDSIDEYFKIEHESIKLDDLIISTIISTKPLKSLCKEDCKGLCPKCGKDLNQGPCDCDSEKTNRDNIDPRLSKLLDVFKG